MQLQHRFTKLCQQYSSNNSLITQLWQELEQQYTHPKRHYHNLQHLQQLVDELSVVQSSVNHWNLLLFAVSYHDIIYKPTESNNELKSAELAMDRLQQLNVPAHEGNACYQQILATKTHALSNDAHINYLTDADLSILGKDAATYACYCNSIRKEYAIYPDLLYKPGRRKVLQHFLSMERIFKTEHFFNRYELQARKNLEEELIQVKD